MKKLIVFVLSIVMCLSVFTGCSGEAKEAEGMTTIGIVQIVEHPSLDTIRESIIKQLADKGYVDGQNVKIDYQNAQGDQSNLNTICKKFVGDQVDLIVAIATPSALAAASATTDIPIIFSAVTDPVGAKLVESLDKPSANVTGTSDAIPVDQVFELCNKLTPNVKKIGFLYTASEPNSKSVVDAAKAIIDQYGMTYEEVTITNTSELQQAAYSLAQKVDAIYTPIDNTIASAMPVLAGVGMETKKPIYVGADSMVADGGYATVGINYETLGQKTGDMVVEVLTGKAISELPVQTLDNFQTVINKTTAEKIGAPAEAEGAIIVE